ncbi:hypothetical protein GBF38_021738 [Nibea albiflora]|uniref:Uncharacterized protein n=1 Tax=Nibea albiflora TaxID=240163 RepID=A0ACB7FFT8_NIBAL|nr:hypothetical protein GBF38_021738 [Nibea albiflora]
MPSGAAHTHRAAVNNTTVVHREKDNRLQRAGAVYTFKSALSEEGLKLTSPLCSKPISSKYMHACFPFTLCKGPKGEYLTELTRRDCRDQCEAALDHGSCLVMVLLLDSLGQCVSALSKRFAAAESIRDSTVNCLPHSHREKHSEVRHRKDTHHQQEDTHKPKVVTNGKVPTSILKRPSPNYGSDTEPNHRRKGERRVRFREPETTVHAYETTPSRPHLALFTCLFLLMSFLGVAMYCTDRRRPQRVCEELEAALAVYLLHMKQLLWGCWIWLTMQ